MKGERVAVRPSEGLGSQRERGGAGCRVLGRGGTVGVSRGAALGSPRVARPAPPPARPLSAPGAALVAEGDIW